MDNKTLYNSNKFKSNKIKTTFIENNFKYLLIIIFLNLFLNSSEELEISLVINGKGKQKVISDSFSPTPSEIIADNTIKCSKTKECILDLDINKVTIKFDGEIVSCKRMLNDLSNIIEIDLSNFDTSKVKDMSYMFNNCKFLEKITFGKIKTSKVENMEGLFHNCEKLISIDLSNFDTSSVTNMGSMFRQCRSLKSINTSRFNTSKVEICLICLAIAMN